MVGTRGGGGASSRSGTSLSSSRSAGNRSQSLMNEFGTSAGSSLWWNCCCCALRALSGGDSELRVGHEGKAQARLLEMGQVDGVQVEEREQSEAKEEAREDEGELRDGQPMEMGDEAALEFAEDGLGEAMAAVVASKWRKRVVMNVGSVGGIYGGRDARLEEWEIRGLIRQKATGGRSVDVSGLFAASRGKAGRPTRVPSEDGLTRDGEKGSQ
jgi:hypothetical protein